MTNEAQTDTWYLAGVSGQNQAREERLHPGAWFGAGSYELTRVGDGAEAHRFAGKAEQSEAGTDFTVKMQPYGVLLPR